MDFRKIELGDEDGIAELSALASEIVKEHYDPILGPVQNDYMIEKFQSVHAIKEQLEHGYLYYLPCLDGKAIGFLGFYPRENDLYLSKFYLHCSQRGKGLSRQLLAFLIDQAKQFGRDAIVLNVNKYNDAIQAYEALGFVRIADEKNPIGEGYYMDDYVYRYQI